MAGFMKRIKNSYNVLTNKNDLSEDHIIFDSGSGGSPFTFRDSAEAVLAPIITRISMDAASIVIRHVDVDEYGSFKRVRESVLDNRLNISANIDQTSRAFLQNAVMTMLDTGSCIIVPVEVSISPKITAAYDILSMRVGEVETWHTRSVDVKVYNDQLGERVTVHLPKSYVAVVYNPLSRIMNEPNSTLRRLQDKLALLDAADNRTNSPSLDLILQLPYVTKTELRKREAATRLAEFEAQLLDSAYGIAYIGSTERITQLNRPVANTLPAQVQYLTEMLYNQLGLTQAVFDGTASEEENLQYYNRTIEPLVKAIVDSMRVAFLTKTALTQRQDIMAFPNLFKMAPLETMADAADKFTRNEILSSNEVRSLIGIHPVDDPSADELRNKNLNKSQETPTDNDVQDQSKE